MVKLENEELPGKVYISAIRIWGGYMVEEQLVKMGALDKAWEWPQ